MLEQLFGSKTRVKLLTLFLNNPGKPFYVREITREIDSLINSVRRELDNLVKAKILIAAATPLESSESKDKDYQLKMRRYYILNTDCVLVSEIKHLFIKNKVFFKEDFLEELKKVSDLKYLLLSGVFTDAKSSPVDLLIVAEGNKDVINKMIKDLEVTLAQDINYCLFSEEDFKYRRDLMDRFLLGIIRNKNNVVLINKIK